VSDDEERLAAYDDEERLLAFDETY